MFAHRSSALNALVSSVAILSAISVLACSDSTDPGAGKPVATVNVAPPSLTLTLGQTGTFTAILQAESGSILTGRTVTWSSSNSSVVTVNDGAVVATGVGTATITATSEGKEKGAIVTVTSAAAQATFAMIAPGGNHTCALTAAGAAFCWGANNLGAIGNGAVGGIYFTPQQVSGNLVFSTIASGMYHSCALTTAGAAYCWGWNLQGQLGDGTNTDRTAPVAVNTSLVFASITTGGDAGGEHSCALTAAGAAWCWGRNVSGELGDNTTTNRSSPVAVQGGLTFTSLSAGNAFTCGLTAAQKAYCWGDADEIGEGTNFDRSAPVAVSGNLTFKSLFSSWWSSCGITAADVAYCWGYVNSSTRTALATEVQGFTFGSMAPANQFTCGTSLTGAGYCWGVNNGGQLGDGSTATKGAPVPVSGSLTFAKIVTGNGHSCALTAAGLAYCWGVNTSGQIGDGTQVSKLIPTAVRSPQ